MKRKIRFAKTVPVPVGLLREVRYYIGQHIDCDCQDDPKEAKDLEAVHEKLIALILQAVRS
jgi:hypothetical protein